EWRAPATITCICHGTSTLFARLNLFPTTALRMETFFKDLKHSARMFWQNRGFTAAAIAALALGIGLNTAIFSVVNTVLLKPAPFPDPDRLVLFQNTSPQGSGGGASP